jgi:salicylate hydroxylase
VLFLSFQLRYPKSILTVESGEHIGQHTWDEEVIRETRGEFLFTYVREPIQSRSLSPKNLTRVLQHADLRKLLYDTAVGCGADIRMGVAVTDVDPDNQRVKLSTGEVIQGDAIIGADGVNGLTRKLMVELDREPDHRNNLYRYRPAFFSHAASLLPV